MARMSFIPTKRFHLFKSVSKYFGPMNRRFILLAICLVISPIFARGKWVKNEWTVKTPSVFIDFWSGRDAASSTAYTVMFMELSPADLVFLCRNSKYIAHYTMELGIWNSQKEQISNQILSDSIMVKDYSLTKSYSWNRLYRFQFEIPDGDYNAVIRVLDENTGKEVVKMASLEVRNKTNFSIDASDLMLARKDLVELKDGRQVPSVLPYPVKIFGAQLPRLFCYFEIYDLDDQTNEPLEYTISCISPDNKQTILKRGKRPKNTPKTPVMHSFNVEDFPPGDYRLVLELRTENNNYQLERNGAFYIYQNPIDLRFSNYQVILNELKLISGKDEWKALKKLPEDQRQQALFDFWKKRDPTPNTTKNELMSEFYRRMAYARRYYRQGRGDNVKLTDQGKVYVLLGSPDDVIREANLERGGEYEIWNYSAQTLKVVFRDDYGFGNFRLIAPYTLLENF